MALYLLPRLEAFFAHVTLELSVIRVNQAMAFQFRLGLEPFVAISAFIREVILMRHHVTL